MDCKFKVGDKVKVYPMYSCGSCEDKILTVIETNRSGLFTIKVKGAKSPDGTEIFTEQSLYKVEVSMSKYDELKERIEGLNNGWTKEADDIIDEIKENSSTPFLIFIPTSKNDGRIHILPASPSIDLKNWNDSLYWYKYHCQCEKNQAFKKALLWLLDHSNIKKDLVGTEQKVEIKGKVYKAKIVEAL